MVSIDPKKLGGDYYKSNSDSRVRFDFNWHDTRCYSWLQELFTKTTMDGQFSGFYLFGCGLFFTPIALIPFRKGEKWAWYTALVAGVVTLIGQTILVYNAGSALASFYLPVSIVLVLLWIVGIALPAKEIFSLNKKTNVS